VVIKYPGKLKNSFTFNLTEHGREILTQLSSKWKVSKGDVIETLIREQDVDYTPLLAKLPSSPLGGRTCCYKGKTRGITTGVYITAKARELVDKKVLSGYFSRGDYIEFLLREKASNAYPSPSYLISAFFGG
jgi:hypothetical protein